MRKIQQYQAVTFIVSMQTNPRSTQSRKLFFSLRSQSFISSRFQTEREHWELLPCKLVAAEAALALDQATQCSKGRANNRASAEKEGMGLADFWRLIPHNSLFFPAKKSGLSIKQNASMNLPAQSLHLLNKNFIYNVSNYFVR